MILYFANRTMEITGHASTELRGGFIILEDTKLEDVETGVTSFECRIGFTDEKRLQLERMTDAGNYLLRSAGNENEFYTIIDVEVDTKAQEVWLYAEDAGLDLLNEIAGEYEAQESHTLEYYINYWTKDSGFEIGDNECPLDATRKLSWDGESTVTERLASVANSFGGYEISYSYDIKGMEVTGKYININKTRGKDEELQLRLNKDIDRIITTKSVANLATAFRCTGAIPDNSDKPITLKGYTYDDGDFYVGTDGGLRSRNAAEKWSRYIWNKEPNQLDGYAGHIWRTYSYETTSQSTLCSHAVTELKKLCDVEINYEIEVGKLPANVNIGDRVNIVDDKGELYLSSRILKLETSETAGTQLATLGEHLIKSSGISQKVEQLANQFAAMSTAGDAAGVANAIAKADEAKQAAEKAQQDFSNLKIGGRNLITGTAEPITSTSPADYNYQYIALTPTVLPLEDGQPYTISAEVEILAGNVTEIAVKLYDASLQTQYEELTAAIINGRIEGTLERVSGLAEAVLLYAGVAGSTAGNSVTFSNIKFEIGNKATAYTPAPEDVDAATADAAATAEAAQGGVASAEAVIEKVTTALNTLTVDADGTTLMDLLEPNEDGTTLLDETEWNFNFADVSAQLSGVSESLNEFGGTVEDTNETVQALQEVITKSDIEGIGNYIKVGTVENEDGTTQPCITLGNNGAFSVQITNTDIRFLDGTNKVAYISNQALNIKKAVIKEELQLGGFVWVITEAGGMGLLWKGVEE